MKKVKVIADIGTNCYNYEAVKLLLPHFLKHYQSIGLRHFILHGNEELIDMLPTFNDCEIDYVKISKRQFRDYKALSCEKYYYAKKMNALSFVNLQPCSEFVCPLWIIQNDIKKKFLKDDEYAFILDLDEFVEITSAELFEEIDSGVNFLKGFLVERFFKEGSIKALQEEYNIFEQMPEKRMFTRFSGKAENKVFLTKKHIEHCFGHHNTLIREWNFNAYQLGKNEAIASAINLIKENALVNQDSTILQSLEQQKESVEPYSPGLKNYNVYHMKFFEQNLPGLKEGRHNKELKFIKDFRIDPDIWTKLQQIT